jgi:hypothetical protein
MEKDTDFVCGYNPIKRSVPYVTAQAVAVLPDTPDWEQDKFDAVVALIQEGEGVVEACKIAQFNKDRFYALCDKEGGANQRAVDRARERYLEARMSERDEINRQCEATLKTCDPKRANSLQNHYKDRIRQIEWEISKRMPKKYGDSMKLSGEIGVTSRVIRLPAKVDVGAPV